MTIKILTLDEAGVRFGGKVFRTRVFPAILMFVVLVGCAVGGFVSYWKGNSPLWTLLVVGWGIAWANQNSRITANKANIESLSAQVGNVSSQATEADKAIVRMETKIEYIIKGIDEIKAEIKVPGRGANRARADFLVC